MAINGKRLKQAREEAGYTQIKAADKLGISNGTLSGYERNYRDPDTEIINKMADLFGVSVEWLMGRTDDSTPLHSDKDEAEFQAFINDPELEMWYKELPKSDEEELRKLRTIWEMIKNEHK